MELLKLPPERRAEIFTQVAARMGLPAQAVEKDWWVTQVLRAIFSTEYGEDILFKGGTSLSKGYGLIERFSEDVDLAISPRLLGMNDLPFPISQGQIKKIKQRANRFVLGQFQSALQNSLIGLGIPDSAFRLVPDPYQSTQADPTAIYLEFDPLFSDASYILPSVKLEVGIRSVRDPVEVRVISSYVKGVFPEVGFSDNPFHVRCITPERTFVEKAILLHERLPQEPGDRLSRHLYDLERLMDSEFCKSALTQNDLFLSTLEFRRAYRPSARVDYDTLSPQTIRFIPAPEIRDSWKADYHKLTENMISGQVLSYEALEVRLMELQDRFRQMTM